MTKVAFLGLGVMGFPMAGHLAKGGRDVTVYNRTAAKAKAWVENIGGARAATPREAREGPEFVFAASATTTICARSRSARTARFAGMEQGQRLRRPHDRFGRSRARACMRRRRSSGSPSSTRLFPAVRPAPRMAR